MSRVVLLVVMLSVLFSGCVSTKPKYIIKKQTRYIALPDKYFKDDVELPGIAKSKKTKYINSNPIERQKMNMKLITRLYRAIGLYKVKLNAIDHYEKRMKDTLNKENNKNLEEVKRLIDEVGKVNVME